MSQEVYNWRKPKPHYDPNDIGKEFQAIDRAIPTTVTSLTDYIAGTYTPTMAIGAGSPTAYSAQMGTYAKVGNRVHVTIRVTLSTLGASTGTVTIQMPFNAAEDSLMEFSATAINLAAGWLRAYITVNTKTLNIQILTFGSPIVVANATQAILRADTDIMISGSYRFT